MVVAGFEAGGPISTFLLHKSSLYLLSPSIGDGQSHHDDGHLVVWRSNVDFL